MSRPWPVPTGGTIIHAIGDVHAGANGFTAPRWGLLSTDVVAGRMQAIPAAQIYTGDMVNTVDAAKDTEFLNGVAGLPVVPRYYAVGNHDIWGNVRTPAQWAATYGMPGPNYTADVGEQLRLVFVGPDSLAADNTVITLSAATQTWLDEQLDATSRDCIIVCHAPLKETVGGNSALMYTSTSDGGVFGVNQGSDANLRTILADHANAKAWVSGHTHSPTTAPDIVVGQTIGSHTMAMINASAVAFTGRAYGVDSELSSAYINWLGDRVEVSYRYHGARGWGDPIGINL